MVKQTLYFLPAPEKLHLGFDGQQDYSLEEIEALSGHPYRSKTDTEGVRQILDLARLVFNNLSWAAGLNFL